MSIGMSWIIFYIMVRYKKTGDQIYGVMARFWINIFALGFALGVATGITMEFQFGTNWSEYSRYVGDIFGASLFPALVPAYEKPEWSLTLSNASSSSLTLTVMLIIALVGMPIVLWYTLFVYKTFKGKVDLNKSIY